ncbi:MAG: hypothetical protein ACD_19C00187G0022 [uncultured bacterium]|nr:MAG: hypothetical protein ACD_19C00187G0022 [uncultured bacterium]
MADLSEFEGKYFIDGQRYNCPFCNVRGAKYSVTTKTDYHKNDDIKVYCYIVECDMCNKKSIHLSYWEWTTEGYMGKWITNPFTSRPHKLNSEKFPEWNDMEPHLDNFFFYHFPTSFFTIDERIPEKIRLLVSEAEGCSKMSFMTGASGSLRRSIYKFLKDQKAIGENYEEKIKWLKTKYSNIESTYFDALFAIKNMNDDDMHEEDWEPFKPSEFNFLIESTKNILNEVYVEPKKRKIGLEKVLAFKLNRKKIESDEAPEG